MSSEDLSSSSSIITPTAMQQRSHRLSRQSHVHHQAEIHNCMEDEEEEEDEIDKIQPITRRKDQTGNITQRTKMERGISRVTNNEDLINKARYQVEQDFSSVTLESRNNPSRGSNHP